MRPNVEEIISTHFSEFADKFERYWKQNSDLVGRLMLCHLMLEWGMEEALKAAAPLIEGWRAARISFSQKNQLLGQTLLLGEFTAAVSEINSYRNRIAHRKEWGDIPEPDFPEVALAYKRLLTKMQNEIPDPFPVGVALVEKFTLLVCPYYFGCAFCFEHVPELHTIVIKKRLSRS